MFIWDSELRTLSKVLLDIALACTDIAESNAANTIDLALEKDKVQVTLQCKEIGHILINFAIDNSVKQVLPLSFPFASPFDSFLKSNVNRAITQRMSRTSTVLTNLSFLAQFLPFWIFHHIFTNKPSTAFIDLLKELSSLGVRQRIACLAGKTCFELWHITALRCTCFLALITRQIVNTFMQPFLWN